MNPRPSEYESDELPDCSTPQLYESRETISRLSRSVLSFRVVLRLPLLIDHRSPDTALVHVDHDRHLACEFLSDQNANSLRDVPDKLSQRHTISLSCRCLSCRAMLYSDTESRYRDDRQRAGSSSCISLSLSPSATGPHQDIAHRGDREHVHRVTLTKRNE